ncbi:MAG: hypothetical protein HYX21_03450 [Candidatus Yanofskybacteria bacterium]|nr:hypothetical protein [Candidatus Yanofskybacteria bacterium]
MNNFFTKVLLGLNDFSKNLMGGFSLEKFNMDVLVALFLLVVIFLVAFSLGKTKILLAIVSTYIALFLLAIFPFVFQIEKFFGDWFGLSAVFWTRLSVFVLFFAVSLAILNKSILKPRMSMQESSPFSILFLSILESGFLVSALMAFSDSASQSKLGLSPWLLAYFGTPTSQFIWAVLPLLALVFLRRKKAV